MDRVMDGSEKKGKQNRCTAKHGVGARISAGAVQATRLLRARATGLAHSPETTGKKWDRNRRVFFLGFGAPSKVGNLDILFLKINLHFANS